jgi:hypothetical protein
MTIQVTKLLELFSKAKQLGATYDIKQYEDGFEVKIYYAWVSDDYYHETLFITNEGESNWEKGNYEFYAMMELLDEKLEEEKQKEIKAQKRKELIARLTSEEKELLGL